MTPTHARINHVPTPETESKVDTLYPTNSAYGKQLRLNVWNLGHGFYGFAASSLVKDGA
jgi:hypothetical protein